MMPGDVHVNRELSQISTNYRLLNAGQFIADKVFPNIPSENPTDFFYRFGTKSFLTTEARKRAPRTQTPGVDWNATKDTYLCEVWGLHHDIEDQLRASADTNFKLEKAGTDLITSQMLMRREKEWLSNFFKTGVWTTDIAGVASGTPTASQFLRFDQAGSTPVSFFRKQRRAFQLQSGVAPNKLVMSTDVWDVLIDHPEIIDRVKYTQSGILTPDVVAKAIGFENAEILVPEAVEADDGTDELSAVAVPATHYMVANSMLMTYASPNAQRNVPSGGYTFSWTGYLGSNAWGGRVKKFRMEEIAADRIEVEAAWGFKVVAPQMGRFYSNVVGALP